MSSHDPEVDALLAAYQAAVHAKDVDAFIGLYDARVKVFDAWGVWSYDGAAAWRGAVAGWFASLGTERVQVTFDDIVAVVTPGLAYVGAIVTYAGVSADGAPLRAMQNRISWVLQRHGQALRIVHEHTSAPAGFEDGKVILQRAGGA